MNSEMAGLQNSFASSTIKKSPRASNRNTQPNGKVSTARKKSVVGHKKSSVFPNKETQWSYFMQAIEPNSAEINIAVDAHLKLTR